MVFRDGRLRVVGIGGTLREGSTSLGGLRRALEADALILSTTSYHGTLAGVTKNALDFTLHALRGVVTPRIVTIPKVWQRSDGEGNITDENYGERLDKLGKLVVEMAEGLSQRAEAVGVSV